MQIHHVTNDTCSTATGLVVVIDVLLAFTTAPFAFAANACDIVPVSTLAEAEALRTRFPSALLMGEVGGFPPAGFDFGNSPAALIGQDLQGETADSADKCGHARYYTQRECRDSHGHQLCLCQRNNTLH